MVAFSKLPVMLSDEDVVDKRYENGKLYVVKCKYDDVLRYIGSTIQTLEHRFKTHKCDKTCSLYKYVDGDWDNWYIELYENYPCKNKYHLRIREGEVQREIATINKNIAGRTKKEYHRQYQLDNAKKVCEIAKKSYYNNRDTISERRKQYQQDNREKIAEKRKQLYQDNREKILERQKQKTTCDHCGSIVNRCTITRHKKTEKCINHKK